MRSTRRPELRAAFVSALLLFSPVFALAQDESAKPAWQAHWDRAYEILESFGGTATPDQFRQVEEQFALSASAALAVGLPDRAIEANRRRIDCLDKICDYPGLLAVSYEILDIQEGQGAPAERARFITRMDIGYLESVTGNARKGIPHLRAAVEWFGAHGPAADQADARLRLADAYRETSQLALALREAEAALRILGESGDPISRMEAHNVAGRVYIALHNLDRAEESLKAGAAIADKVAPSYRPEFLRSMSLLARLRGDREQSKALLHDAFRALYEQHDTQRAGYCLVGLGQLELDGDRPQAAVTWCLFARTVGGDHPLLQSRALLAQGRAHFALHELAKARETLDESIQRAKQVQDPLGAVWAHAELADVSLAEGDTDEAVAHLKTALRGMATAVGGLTPLSAAAVRQQKGRLADRAVQVAFAQTDPAVALELLERTRACSLIVDLGGRERMVPTGADPILEGDRDRARAAISAAQANHEAAIRSGVRKRIRDARGALVTARRNYEIACNLLRSGSRSGIVTPDGNVTTLAEARASLAKGEVIVLYARAAGQLHAMVIGRRAVTRHDLGSMKKVSAEVRRLRKVIQAGPADDAVAALRRRIIEPLALPAEVRRVLVSPAGSLATVPLSALLPGKEVAFIPSATSRTLLATGTPESGTQILALGDPHYSGEHRQALAKVYRGTVGLASLPESRLEIEAVATGEGDICLLGPDATETRFREALSQSPRWRAVHFACHGLIDFEFPGWSSLALTPDGTEDGYLSVCEIIEMRIPADLAVLSACSTGVGTEIRSEGHIALPGAFLHAGTPRVLATLWRVEDRAAREMMTEFYRLWNPGGDAKGLGAAAALKKAQDALRRKGYDAPRHWAAWVLWGLPD